MAKDLTWFRTWQAGNRAFMAGMRKGDAGIAALPPPPAGGEEWVGSCGEVGVLMNPTFEKLSGPAALLFAATLLALLTDLLDGDKK
jgi:hypothetical protein